MGGFDPFYFVYVGVFVGALLAFEGVRQALSRKERREAAKSRRMRMLNAGKTTGEVLELLRAPPGRGPFQRLPLVSNLPQRLRQADIRISVQIFVLLCVLAGLAVFVVASQYIGPLQAAAAAVGLGILGPIAVVDAKRKARSAKLVAQLPDALDLMSRGLRVGHPLNTSIASVATEMPDPIGTEFGIVVDQVSYGDDIVTAFKELAERVDEEDVYYLAVSIGIQHGTGGNLARLLGVLAKVIRDRATIRRKIKAISAEGRATMWIISALPVVIFVAVNIATPEFYGEVWGDPLFMPAMALIVGLIVANFLALRKLVNFKF